MRLSRSVLAAVCFVISAPAVIGTHSLALASGPAPDAKVILEEAAKAIAKLHAISYDASGRAEGPLAAGTPAHTAAVSLTRAEAGGWKLALTGTVQGGGDGAKAPTHLTLGYDGATAWALR